MNKQIRQVGVRVVSYPLVTCVFFLVKNLIYDGSLIIKPGNIDTLFYVFSILVLCEVLSFIVFRKEKACWYSYFTNSISLGCVLLALNVVGINIELENILIIFGISLLTRIISCFL